VGRGFGWDGHVLLLYATEEQRRASVTAWIRRGLETEAKIVYVESADVSPARSLLHVLRDGDVDVTAELDGGRLQIVDPDVGLGPTWQAELVAEGLAAGYPTVRLGGDASTSWTVMSPAAHADAERAADELCQAMPASILCQYATTLPASLVERACSMHAGGVRETMVQILPIQDGVALLGEVDMSNVTTLRSALIAGCARAPDQNTSFVVDLAGLTFLDVAGARTLATATAALRERGVTVRLRAAAPLVDRLLRQLGMTRVDRIVLESGAS
jgi:anti-anti-sigma factor